MGAARPALGQQRGLEGAVASAVSGRQHLAGEVVEGVVSFWGESCTNHVGHLACLTGPLEVHQSPLAGPIQPFGHRNSQRSRREVGRQECDLGQSEPFLRSISPISQKGKRRHKEI